MYAKNPNASEHRNAKSEKLHKVLHGQTLYSILKQHDFNETQIQNILRAKSFPRGFIILPQQRYLSLRHKSSNQTDLIFFDRQSDHLYRFWRKGKDESGARKENVSYDIRLKTVSGHVNGSLIGSILQVIDDKWVAYRFMDAFVLDHNIPHGLQRGADFEITVEQKFYEGIFIQNGEILEAMLQIGSDRVARHFMKSTTGGAFIDIAAPEQTKRPLYAPVNYLHVSSKFNPRRRHPIKRSIQPHLGIDFALPSGEDVFTAYAGRVLRTGRNHAAGHYVVILHPNGLETYYNHMSEVAKNIKPGVYVANGQRLGAIGCTGYCTKPHLHFAIKRQGRFVNPAQYIKSYPFLVKEALAKFIAKNNETESVETTVQ